MLVSLILSAALSALSDYWTPESLPGGAWLWHILNGLISFGVICLLFAIIFKYLPDAEIRWMDVWVGAVLTALLFTVGKYLLGLYLGRGSVTSSYGAAGSLVLILLWVYYSSLILLYGAELTRVYADHFGPGLRPSPNAVRLTREDLARQGIPRDEDIRIAAGRQHP